MKNIDSTIYCYKYTSNIDNLISKLNVGAYYREYMIDYHNQNSFSVGVERLGHSSGRWFEASIEKIEDYYLVKGKLVVLPKTENNKMGFFEKLKTVLICILFSPVLLVMAIAMFVSWIIKKIKKDPFATNDPEKRLDYFMINYLGCEKRDSLICYSEPERIDFNEFKKRVIKVYASNVSKKGLKQHVLSRGNYIWHLFSFELIDKDNYLIGEEAKKAFDACNKKDAIVFNELPHDHFVSINEDYGTSEQISNSGELYVFANDLSWIYFGTHEESIGLGPYFISKNRGVQK